MKKGELLGYIEDFQKELSTHQTLWSNSFDAYGRADYPINNLDQLETQARNLRRTLGGLRPYLEEFRRFWILSKFETSWDALEIAVSLNNPPSMRDSSIRFVIEFLDLIIGELQSSDLDSEARRAGRRDEYIVSSRFIELKEISSENFDLTKLIRLCEELNVSYANECYYSVAMLLRSIIDHVPPIFGFKTFKEVFNNYSGNNSFKKLMQKLDESLRKIADEYLHDIIEKKVKKPNKKSVDFCPSLDRLLEEICQLLKSKDGG